MIKFVGEEITYKSDNAFDDDDVITLSKVSEEFEYGCIPVYQAFLRFRALPEELLLEIRRKAEERLDREDLALDDTTRALEERLCQKRLSVWAKLAGQTQDAQEIRDFLYKLHDCFEMHKMRFLDEYSPQTKE